MSKPDKAKLKLFGTSKRPLRASALQNFVKCPMRAVMMFFQDDDESGAAADTGSAMHHAASSYHRIGDPVEAQRQMELNKKEYPLANLSEAGYMFRLYQRDPRNSKAKIIKIEQEVKITLPPTKEDKTKEEIVIVGHIDYIKEESGQLIVDDLKTSKLPGSTLILNHLYQMAAYTYGAKLLMKKEVYPGRIIRIRTYTDGNNHKIISPSGVFFSMPWTLTDIPFILEGLRHIVAKIRNGDVWVNPSVDNCAWCPAKSIDYCIPELVKLNVKR